MSTQDLARSLNVTLRSAQRIVRLYTQYTGSVVQSGLGRTVFQLTPEQLESILKIKTLADQTKIPIETLFTLKASHHLDALLTFLNPEGTLTTSTPEPAAAASLSQLCDDVQYLREQNTHILVTVNNIARQQSGPTPAPAPKINRSES